jgi:hypothetical protein
VVAYSEVSVGTVLLLGVGMGDCQTSARFLAYSKYWRQNVKQAYAKQRGENNNQVNAQRTKHANITYEGERNKQSKQQERRTRQIKQAVGVENKTNKASSGSGERNTKVVPAGNVAKFRRVAVAGKKVQPQEPGRAN